MVQKLEGIYLYITWILQLSGVDCFTAAAPGLCNQINRDPIYSERCKDKKDLPRFQETG